MKHTAEYDYTDLHLIFDVAGDTGSDFSASSHGLFTEASYSFMAAVLIGCKIGDLELGLEDTKKVLTAHTRRGETVSQLIQRIERDEGERLTDGAPVCEVA